MSERVAESDSVAVATRVSLKRSPAGEKPERRDGKEGGQGSGGVLFRLGTGVEAGRPSTPSGAARCDGYEDPRGLRGIPHRVYFDGDGGHHARPEPAFGASRGSEEEGGPEENGERREGQEGIRAHGGRRGQEGIRAQGDRRERREGIRAHGDRREGQEGIRAHGGRRGQEGIRAQGDRRERREGIRAHGDRREGQEGIRAHGAEEEGRGGEEHAKGQRQPGLDGGAREGVKLEGAVGETATQAAEGQSHAPEGRQGQESGAQVPCATGDSRESRYGTSHALHEGPRVQEDGLPRQGDQPRHAAQGRGAERTASPAHLGPAPQGPLCPDQGQGAAVRRSHGVRDHSGCSRAGAGAVKDATGATGDTAKDATRSCDQDRGWFRVASAATGATKAQIADPSSQSSSSLGGMVNGFQPRRSGQQGEEEGQDREPGAQAEARPDSGRAGPDRGSGWKHPCGVSASAQESTSPSTEDACLRSFSSLGAALALQEKIAFEHVCVGELGEHGVHVELGEHGVVDQDPARAVTKTRPGFFEEIRTTLGRSAGDALKGNMFSGATFLIIPRAPIVSEVEVWSQPGARTRSRTVVCVKCR